MPYVSSFSNSAQSSNSSEQYQPALASLAEPRSRLGENLADLATLQRAAIAKAYGDILLNGGHLGC